MAQLSLFGAVLPVSNTGTVGAPQMLHVNVRQWSGTLAGGIASVEAWLEVNNRWTLSFALRWAVDSDGHPEPHPQRPSAKAHFRLRDELSESAPAGASVSVRCGPLRVERSDFPANCLLEVNGALVVAALDMPLLNDSAAPLTVLTSSGGFTLNLPASELRLMPGFLTQDITHRMQMEVIPGFPTAVGLFSHAAPSIEQRLSLQSIPTTTALEFVPESQETLAALHVDLFDRASAPSAQNSAVAALALSGHRFKLLFELANGKPLLSGMQALPGFRLHVLGLASTRYKHAEFFSGNALNLNLRTGTEGRPSTLLVAPFEEKSPALHALQVGNDFALHGFLQKSRFHLREGDRIRLRCARSIPNAGSSAVSINPSIVRDLTFPWLDLESQAPRDLFQMAKPGDAYLAHSLEVDPRRIVTFSFSGTRFALPLLDRRFMQSATTAEQKEYQNDIDAVATNVLDAVQEITHETYFREKPIVNGSAAIQPTHVFLENKPLLEPYEAERLYGPFGLKVTIPAGKPPDYLVLDEPPFDTFSHEELSTGSPDFAIGGEPRPIEAGKPTVILKLSSKIKLEDIFRNHDLLDLPIPGNRSKKLFADAIDDVVKRPEWTGLLMFNLPLGKSGALAGRMVPGEVSLAYVAITPPQPGQSTPSIYARARFQNSDPVPGSQGGDYNETRFRVNEVDIAWADSHLSSFYLSSVLHFETFFGLRPNQDQPSSVTIIGSYDRTRETISFLGRLPQPLKLLPEPSGFGPLKQVFVRSAEVRTIEGRAAISLDGDIALQNIDVGAVLGNSHQMKAKDNRQIRFQGLQIPLPNLGVSWEWLQIRYPSLQLDLDLPPFDLDFLKLQIGSFWMDWPQAGSHFDWNSVVKLKSPGGWSGPSFVFNLRMELMKLPELAVKLGFPRITLEFAFGLWQDNGRWSSDCTAIGLRALGFDRLNLDLMRFLEIRSDKVELAQAKDVDGNMVAALQLLNLEVLILRKTIISGTTAFIFAGEGGDVSLALFMGRTDGEPVGSFGPVDLRWVLIGHHVSIHQDFAAQLMDVGVSTKQADINASNAIRAAADNKEFIRAGTKANQGGWIFAAAFQLGQLLDAKFLFQDKAYYGIALGGGIFKEWFGYDIAISVLYIKAAEPNQDAFRVSVRVPRVTLPTFQFTGGVVTIQIAMDGSFFLDVGFPRLNPQGGRMWDRALGAIVTPLQGSGGFYIQKYNIHTPAGSGLLISAGYALQAGLGGAFGGGVFTVWVTAGFYFILEGSIYLQSGNVQALRLVGAVGILIRGGGHLNFWVISAWIEITISAEARVTLSWGTMPQEYHQIGSGELILPQGTVRIDLDLTVYASASAEACIGGGWFRICAGISVTIPIRYRLSLELK